MNTEHPTIKWYEANSPQSRPRVETLDSSELRRICIALGADDVGFVEVDRPALALQKADLLQLMPETKTIASMVFRLHRENLRSTVHSVANLEFRHGWTRANHTSRTIAARLQEMGIRAVSAPVGFPYEAERWPGKMWLTSDKLLAVEAGLGRMGWNRLVLHPEFGAFVVLGTLLVDTKVTSYGVPLEFSPCIECKLCVAACPTGAVGSDGHFDFTSCYTHNYRERLGGFIDWVENLAHAKTARDYRARVSDRETVSMWQNLSIGPQTKCDRCVAVCPAGKEAIGEFLEDRPAYVNRTVKRFREKPETIYVVSGSDAEEHVTRDSPHKVLKRVSNGIRPPSVASFLFALPLLFQRNCSQGLDATFHFTFTGSESVTGTVVIRNKTITVEQGHVGHADLTVVADSRTWLRILARETHILRAVLARKLRVKGPLSLMKAFGACFPS
ncbi:MAG: SCP2 sterol-binding domain-containing protein [Thermodesulfobacteriota bacterium]